MKCTKFGNYLLRDWSNFTICWVSRAGESIWSWWVKFHHTLGQQGWRVHLVVVGQISPYAGYAVLASPFSHGRVKFHHTLGMQCWRVHLIVGGSHFTVRRVGESIWSLGPQRLLVHDIHASAKASYYDCAIAILFFSSFVLYCCWPCCCLPTYLQLATSEM